MIQADDKLSVFHSPTDAANLFLHEFYDLFVVMFD